MEKNRASAGPTKNSANYQSKQADNEQKKRRKFLKRAIWGISALIVCLLIVLIIPNAAQIKCLFSGHQWKTATCTAPKTCSVCGKTEGETLAHKWVAATCTIAKHCSVCGQEEGNLKAHTWVDATCTEAKHCIVCQETVGKELGHDWQEATYETPKTCKNCGLTDGVNLKGYIQKDVTLKLKYTDIMLGVGYKVQLTLDCELDPTEVSWIVEDSSIASVDKNGCVKALSSGTTSVTAKYGGQEVKCIVRCI